MSVDRTVVSFTVHFSKDDANDGVAIGPGEILRFDQVVTNIGNGYNPLTGIFTAPVGGAYAFFLSNHVPYNHKTFAILSINKQSTVIGYLYAGFPNLTNEGSVLVTTHMAAGEQVWVKQIRGTAVRGGAWTVFTGFRL